MGFKLYNKRERERKSAVESSKHKRKSPRVLAPLFDFSPC